MTRPHLEDLADESGARADECESVMNALEALQCKAMKLNRESSLEYGDLINSLQESFCHARSMRNKEAESAPDLDDIYPGRRRPAA